MRGTTRNIDPDHQRCPPIDLCGSYYMDSCTGCFESEDGHPVGDYPIHPEYGCYVGSGCRECGATGCELCDHMGCDQCGGTGVAKRLAIYPYMDIEESRLIDAGVF